LLRLAQGDKAASAAGIRRALRETPHRLPRARLLPAFVVIMLANSELDDAATAARELDQTARSQRTEVLRAQAGYAVGSVKLAAGDPTGASWRYGRHWACGLDWRAVRGGAGACAHRARLPGT
jgi:hypothetical protein